MEVSMDTSPPGLSSIPQQSFPASPAGSRKRSIQDLDDATTATPTPTSGGFKKPSNPENQENSDPTAGTSAASSKPATPSDDKPVEVAVEIRSSSTPQQEAGAESALTAIPNPNTNNNTTMDNTSSSTSQPAGLGTPAAKKRKLSPASKDAKEKEKQAKQQEKEAKEKQKLEEKAKKEEEKAKKEEEKRAKEEEKKKRDAEKEEERKKKEEKKKAKEEEKAAKEAAKEEEKRKKDEEKSKKERAQMKLNSFFAKPKAPAQPSQPSAFASPKKSSGESASNESTEPVSTVSDYQRVFPAFFLQSHTTVAPPHRFERDSEALRHMRESVDASLKSGAGSSQEPPIFRPSEVFRIMPYKRRFGRQSASIKEILLKLQNSGDSNDSEIPGTKPGTLTPDLLKAFRMKSFRFGEDVRPPYQGTYSKSVPLSAATKLSRNPFHRGLPETNYDYDSEAEWEEPEEGEDLDSEEEDEGSDDGDDDMDGFLDDEEDNLVDGKRRLIVGDLEPVNSGIRWQENGVDPELATYKIETIADGVAFPIDPFSTAYWQKPKAADPAPGGPGRSTLHSFMTGANGGSASTTEVGGLALLSKARRPFPPDQLAEFKQVVDGSDMTKTGLLEILKKRFPKVSKEALKDTLNNVAARVGQKEVDKKWVCK